jgi:hypothetical protein
MTSKLLAIRIRRRAVAAAVFSGRQLDHLDILHLCNEPEIVTDAVARFLVRVIENFKPADVALGSSRAPQGERVRALTEMTERMLSSAGIPIWRVEDKAVLESFAVPKLKNKEQLRPIVQSFWPHLGHRQLAAFEAAALGLHLQIERLLSQH